MIPSWFYLALCLALLVVPPIIQCRQINRRRDAFRAVDAERIARENTAPLGNADLLELQRVQTDHAKRAAVLAKKENEVITEALAKLGGKSA